MDVSIPEATYPDTDQCLNSWTALLVDQGLGWRGPMAEEYKMLEIIFNDQQHNGSSDSGAATGTGGRMVCWEF